MRGLQIIPYDTKFDFVGKRYIAYFISIAIIVLSFLVITFKGFNLGIDFKGGVSIEIRTQDSADIANLRTTLNKLNLGDIKLQDFGDNSNFLIRIEHQTEGVEANAKAIQSVKNSLNKYFNNKVNYRKIETVGAKVSESLITNGLWALLFAIIGMLLYIWNRFEWEYGICGIIALLHDSIAVLGFYAISGFEFNESALAALLTTIGYSINDTVVIYDRLRENIVKHKDKKIFNIINISLNETLSRTILTSGTTILSLFSLYFFGGPIIENFSMPIIIGVIFGTFSSIFLSANLLLFFDIRKKKKQELDIMPYGPGA